jgi:Uncharacterized conserved protein
MYRFFLIFFLYSFLLVGCMQNEVILPDGTKIEVELAKTRQQTERGLMFRENLEENKGMLFIFSKDEERYFWMKNTLIDLDIIFIDSKGKIINIAEEVPHSYIAASEEEVATAEGFGKYVLEVNGGFAKKHNLKAGDRLNLKIK